MIMKATKRTKEFKALELKFDESSSNPHTVYFKEHSVREQTAAKPSGRTLFVVNIPPYADEKGIQNAFKEAGTITSVIVTDKPGITEEKPETFIQEHPKSIFKVAYIIFSKESELQKALKLNYLHPLSSEGHTIKTGLSKWIHEYNKQFINPKVLKNRVEVFMKKYDEDMKLIEEKEKGLEQEDDEGWVTVTKKGKVQSFARSEKVENKIMAKEEKGKKRKELKNFYTFQIRESKMKHIVALRQKFEEDKKKIAQIKQTRRFKPF